MDRHMPLFKEDEHNSDCFPSIVCIIEEFHLLFNETYGTDKQLLNDAIEGLLKTGRHTKIHMILSTQELTKKNLQFKGGNNITLRIAFVCANTYESQAIINAVGAEKLLGQGALKFKSSINKISLMDMQGLFITDGEIAELLEIITFEQKNIGLL